MGQMVDRRRSENRKPDRRKGWELLGRNLAKRMIELNCFEKAESVLRKRAKFLEPIL